MDKLQKYYNHIVNELMKNTIFDQYDELGNTYTTKGHLKGKKDGAYVKLPYKTSQDWYRIDLGIPLPFKHDGIADSNFFEHIEDNYGTTEDDNWEIWDMYRERVINIIDGQ